MEKIEYDPTDYQLDSYGKFGLSDMDISEMANEQSVKMLLHQSFVNLHELKATKNELIISRKQVESLQGKRENLRVSLAKAKADAGVDIASILMSLLGGFAINLLTTDWSDSLGWVIFIICIATVITFKASSIFSIFSKNKSDVNGDL